MNKIYNSSNTWSIEQGDYKRKVEAGPSYKNHYRNRKLTKKLLSGAYIILFISALYALMYIIAR